MTCGFNSQSRLSMDTTRVKTKEKAKKQCSGERWNVKLDMTWGQAESLARKRAE